MDDFENKNAKITFLPYAIANNNTMSNHQKIAKPENGMKVKNKSSSNISVFSKAPFHSLEN